MVSQNLYKAYMYVCDVTRSCYILGEEIFFKIEIGYLEAAVAILRLRGLLATTVIF